MFRMIKRLVVALGIVAALFLLPSVAANSRPTPAHAQSGTETEIAALLDAYATALQHEMQYGTTQVLVDPSTGEQLEVLTGPSQAKMDQLWAETLSRIWAIRARPESERAATVELLRQVSGAEPSFIGLARSPFAPSVELEEYESGRYFYLVEVRSGQITKAWLKDQRDYDTVARYSRAMLLEKARGLVGRFAQDLDLAGLIPSEYDKGPVLFFRWEDPSERLPDGTVPFVQVALSVSGELLNFENTLPLTPDAGARASLVTAERLLVAPPAMAIGANEIYANGGGQWGWEKVSGYSTKNNAGYCYYAGWCSPKHFYYANSPSGNNTYWGTNHRGKWRATSYMRYRYTRTAAYIPCTNATAVVMYRKWYNGGASFVENGVDQSIWCNTWVQMSSTLYDIQRVVLPNTNERGYTQEIAWDEVWDYVP